MPASAADACIQHATWACLPPKRIHACTQDMWTFDGHSLHEPASCTLAPSSTLLLMLPNADQLLMHCHHHHTSFCPCKPTCRPWATAAALQNTLAEKGSRGLKQGLDQLQQPTTTTVHTKARVKQLVKQTARSSTVHIKRQGSLNLPLPAVSHQPLPSCKCV
jgi:hypothetical protein